MKLVYKKLETFQTAEGVMIPIFRDWDSLKDNYKPCMAYMSTVKPKMSKGPILHTKKSGYLTVFGQNIEIEYFDENQIKTFIICNEIGDTHAVYIPPGEPIKFINKSETVTAQIINLPDESWKPGLSDTIKFENWSEYLNYVN